MEKTKKVIVLSGQTAAGKSSLALRLCQRFNGEIISADSMQVYRGMDIGTAKANPEDQNRVRHHLLDIRGIDEAFSAADFVRHAKNALSDVAARGKIPFVTGGTGLYTEMLFCYGAPFWEAKDPNLRDALFKEAEKDKTALYRRLQAVDPEAALKTHPNNIKRVVRYLEIFEVTGKTPTQMNTLCAMREKIYKPLFVCLFSEDREYIYERIGLRVDEMLKNGLVKEARSLWEKGLENTPTASAAIGYKELFPYFKGEISLSEASENIKKHTRHYAKRQLTYFKRVPGAVFLDIKNEDCQNEAEKIIALFLEGAKP